MRRSIVERYGRGARYDPSFQQGVWRTVPSWLSRLVCHINGHRSSLVAGGALVACSRCGLVTEPCKGFEPPEPWTPPPPMEP